MCIKKILIIIVLIRILQKKITVYLIVKSIYISLYSETKLLITKIYYIKSKSLFTSYYDGYNETMNLLTYRFKLIISDLIFFFGFTTVIFYGFFAATLLLSFLFSLKLHHYNFIIIFYFIITTENRIK